MTEASLSLVQREIRFGWDCNIVLVQSTIAGG